MIRHYLFVRFEVDFSNRKYKQFKWNSVFTANRLFSVVYRNRLIPLQLQYDHYD